MEVRVGGAVHVVAGPVVELLCVDGGLAGVGDPLAMEIIAGGQLKVAVRLLAH